LGFDFRGCAPHSDPRPKEKRVFPFPIYATVGLLY
jgi:hypothetical protein